MTNKGKKYLVCPDCGRRGVDVIRGYQFEPLYKCRYCQFRTWGARCTAYLRERGRLGLAQSTGRAVVAFDQLGDAVKASIERGECEPEAQNG